MCTTTVNKLVKFYFLFFRLKKTNVLLVRSLWLSALHIILVFSFSLSNTMTSLHMKTTSQAYGDFAYVSSRYRNINQKIYTTTAPPAVDEAYRLWKNDWLPTINHDYGHFYDVLAEKRRTQVLKSPDAWSYNINLGTMWCFSRKAE